MRVYVYVSVYVPVSGQGVITDRQPATNDL